MGCFRECTSGIAKYILFAFNLLILICAIALITLAVMARVNTSGVDIMSINSLTIAVGVIIALIAFFGCCGAIKESSCLLLSYAIILLIIFIIQLVLAILAFVAIRNEGVELSDFVRNQLTDLYNHRDQSINQDSLNGIHRSLGCCGLDGPNSTEVIINNQIMPSCCAKDTVECNKDTAFQDGCVSALTQFLKDNVKIIGIVAILFAGVELLCVIFAFCVRNSIARQGKYV